MLNWQWEIIIKDENITYKWNFKDDVPYWQWKITFKENEKTYVYEVWFEVNKLNWQEIKIFNQRKKCEYNKVKKDVFQLIVNPN
jgi:hypothetical protein